MALLGVLVLLAGLFATLLILAPIEIRSEWALRFIETRVSAAAGGRFTCERVLLSFWPRIGFTVEGVDLERDDLSASADALILVPRIMPLLRGSLQPAAVQVHAPDIRIDPSVFPRRTTAAANDTTRLADLAAAGHLLGRLPQTDIELVDGRLHIAIPGGFVLEIAALQAELRPGGGRLKAALSCRSNLWQHLELTADLATTPLAGSVALALSDLEPAALMAALFPAGPFQVVDGRVNLRLELSPEGLDRIQGRLAGDIPHLTIRHENEETRLSVAALTAAVEAGPGRLAVSIPQLDIRHPMAAASLNLLYDERATPRISIGIEGHSVDVEAVRRAARVLLATSEDAGEVFDVLRGGFVPWIKVDLAGETPADLDELKNIEIRGRLEQGRLFIPGVKLDLDGVAGEVRIAGGILEGSRLAARFLKTQGENGSLRLGLAAADPLLELSIPMTADLEPLPEVLARVVKDEEFLAELALLEQFSGRARGRLDLTGTTAAVKVRVEAAELDVRARHRRIAAPLAVTGGRMVYDESGITLEEADVRLGGSHIPRLRARLGLGPAPALQASAPAAEIDLAELLRQVEALGLPDWLGSLEGRLRLQPWQFSGELAAPQSWEFHGAGQVQNLQLTSGLLPAAVRLAAASWTCRGRRLSVETGEAFMGATHLQALAGDFDWSEIPRLEIANGLISVDVADLVRLIDPHLDLHAHLGPLEPLSGELLLTGLQGRLSFPAAGARELAVSATLEQGAVRSAHLPADIALRAGELSLQAHRLDIRQLDAALAESALKGAELRIDWGRQGDLHFLVDSLRIECGESYPWLARLPALAWLQRDIAGLGGTASLSGVLVGGKIHAPHRWRIRGEATLNHLGITTTFLKEPIRIRNGRVQVENGPDPPGEGLSVRIEDFQVAVGSTRVMASGEIRPAAEAVALDLSLSAESIVWDEISALADRFAERDSGKGREVTGRVELHVDELALAGHQFQPVLARVTFDPGRTRVEVERAGLCGITTIGRIDLAGGKIDAYLVPVADNTLLDRTLGCLTREKSLATGQFNIDGTIEAQAVPADLLKAMTGRLQFISDNGRILRSTLLARVLSLLNITEIYRGRMPDLTGQGLEYKRTQIAAELLNGRLIIHSWTLDGPNLWLGARGSVDLSAGTLELFIVVSPFTTFDRIIRAVPLLGYVLGGRLVGIPIRASGPIADPEVVPMHPAAVGQSVLEMVERALLLPVHIVQPLIPGIEEGRDERGTTLIRE